MTDLSHIDHLSRVTGPTAHPGNDADPQETREWLDALEAVISHEGPGRAHFLLEELVALGHRTGINMPYSANTEYTNSIPADQQPVTPGDYELEQKIRDYAGKDVDITLIDRKAYLDYIPNIPLEMFEGRDPASTMHMDLIGPLAQFWLIPYLATDEGAMRFAWLLGTGETRGIALIFLLAGALMLVAVLIAFASPPYRLLSRAYAAAPPSEGAAGSGSAELL